MQAGLSVEAIQYKRYAAKILTILFRDFLSANKKSSKKQVAGK
jgi:hypothetical protein